MSCPTCAHTMQRLRGGNTWCPRCGTLNDDVGVAMPMLVERCRKFGPTLGARWGSLWVQLGIEESIRLPAERQNVGNLLDSVRAAD